MVDTQLGTRAAEADGRGERPSVLNPMGYPPKVSPKALAPRLDSLNGKRLFLVDCRFDDSDLFLTQVRDWLVEHMPQVETELVRLSSVYTRDDPETWARIRANGDAALVGVGH
ncbi:MAG TPA: hypothetical protein VII06_15455 [Chloroflexota bacterium]